MENKEYQTAFSKAMLTGLFTGIVATLVCLLFAVIYRYQTGFDLYLIINFPAIIFGCNLILAVIGMVYFVFRRFIKNGSVVFAIVFLGITLLCLWKVQGVERSDLHKLTVEFRQLLSGIIIILAISACMIPVLYNYKKFMDTVI